MPKATVVDVTTCDICGAEVREGSMFCYNCGGSVSKEDKLDTIPPPAEPIVARTDEDPPNGAAAVVAYDPAKRRAERSERRKVRAANRPPTEIIWEPRQGVSWVFIAATAVLVLIALMIVAAAFYLR